MAQIILHKDGAYNIYSTIMDAPLFESALSLLQLKEYIKDEFGEDGLRNLYRRLERAHEIGCSAYDASDLEDCLCCNRAGKNEKTLSYKEFIKKYLTLEK